MTARKVKKLELGDVAEIVIGSCVLGFPLTVTEEVWKLGEDLSWPNMIGVVAFSIFFVAAFAHFRHYRSATGQHKLDFAMRVLLTYGVTLACCALMLALVDKFDLFDEPAIAMKRTMLVAFPASFAATVVDTFD